jgi:hypothetical protein
MEGRAATKKLRIVILLSVRHGQQKWSLNDGRSPNFRGVRVAPGTGYNREVENRRASRNGPVSEHPPEIPYVSIRRFFVTSRA